MEVARFRKYEEHFQNSARIISRELTRLNQSNGSVDAVLNSTVEIEGELAEAEGFFRAMEAEFRTAPPNDRPVLRERIESYRTELTRLRQTFTQNRTTAESAALLAANSDESRQRLLRNNRLLDDSTRTLQETRGLIAASEQTGTTALVNLEQQKEMLMDAQDNVGRTNAVTAEARRILAAMGTRAILHKLCVIFIIIALAVAIVMVAYYGLKK